MTGRRQGELTLREHLEELRRRLFISALAVAAGVVVGFIFHRPILRVLARPVEGTLGVPNPPFIFTSVTEMIGVSMKIAFLSGLVLAIPVIVYQVVMFVSPGLTPRERRFLFLFLPGVFAAFLSGVAFGYAVLIPPAMRFLLTFNTDLAVPMITIGNYVNLIVNLLLWMGVVFETPVLMFVLAWLRIVRYKTFARWRRNAFILAFVLGAMITPTFDPVNQSLVAVPLIALYELGVWLAWLARRGDRPKVPKAG